VRREELEEAVGLGRATVEVVELTRRHCRHARVELVGGNSFAGSMLGLPMGLVEVRCEHAPPPRSQGHRALDLAVEFYQANCVACPHREGTGELPNLATVAGERAAAEAARQEAVRRATEERARRRDVRRERRRRFLAGEGHVIRDLGDALDRLDRAEPQPEPSTVLEQKAAREVLDAARGAPELFGPVRYRHRGFYRFRGAGRPGPFWPLPGAASAGGRLECPAAAQVSGCRAVAGAYGAGATT